VNKKVVWTKGYGFAIEKFGFTPLKTPEVFMERHIPTVHGAGVGPRASD
jgi:hypothetical protein